MTDSQSFHLFAHLPGATREPSDSESGSLSPYDVRSADSGYAWLLLVAGLLPSAVGTYFGCSLVPPHSLSWLTLFLRSAAYVSLTALVSMATFWLFWTFLSIKPSFQPVILAYGTCGISMFFPATSLLFGKHSWWVFVMLAGMSTSASLYLRALFPIEESQTPMYSGPMFKGMAPDQKSLRSTVLIAFLLECSVVFLVVGHIFFTCALLSISFFLLGWRFNVQLETIRRVAADVALLKQRILMQYLVAILVTAVSLIPFLRGGSWIKGFSLLLGSGSVMPERSIHKSKPVAMDGDNSFVGIILFPPLRKKTEIVPPQSHAASVNSWTKSQPLVIRFDGPYWYFKAPNHDPGLRPHVVRGKSTEARIHSTDRRPIMMEARQSLGIPMDRSCCREIQVAITNADTSPGQISLGVSLVNSTLPTSSPIKGKAETLGVKVIQSSEPQHFWIERTPVDEVLTFPIPSRGKFPQFNEIKVLFLPAPERSLGAPKVAIRSFRLVPR